MAIASTGVMVDGETIEADDVVLCTNAYTPLILPELRLGQSSRARPDPGHASVARAAAASLRDQLRQGVWPPRRPDGKILCGGFRRMDQDEGLVIMRSGSPRPSSPASPPA